MNIFKYDNDIVDIHIKSVYVRDTLPGIPNLRLLPGLVI
jgi:hypothetical protein